MKTKIVYVLVSQESDYYYEMLQLSHYSLRLYHPKDTVEVVMDEDTHQRLVEKQAAMLNDVTPVVVPIPSEYTIMQRSRYLKTSLRQHVKGDFLYLDCDTIIYNSLSDIDTMNVSIAMNSYGNDEFCYRNSYHVRYCEKAGFLNLDGEPYYNSGVFFVKDVAITHKFFDVWHQQWILSLHNGEPHDQPALCQSNKKTNYIIEELPAIWNCMIETHVDINKIKIRHYFSGNICLLSSMIFTHIRKTGIKDGLDNLVHNPHTICESILTISDEKVIQFICSDSFYIYEAIPNLYHYLSKINGLLTNLYMFCSRLKRLAQNI